MNIAYKCALVPEQIESKNKLELQNIEVQLLPGDDLSLIEKIQGKIVSIHLPLPPFCNLTSIIEAIKNNGEDLKLIKESIEWCKKLNCGLIVHANITLEKLYNMDKEEVLINFINESGIVWHIENVTDEISNENDCIKAPVQICDYINKKLKKQICFPLLDICHFLMIQENFCSSLKYNLKQAIEMYKSDNYYIHLSDKLGSGDPHTGGVHGFNFKYNEPLLTNILKTCERYNPTLVLEVYENDYGNPLNAMDLHERIEKNITE